MLCLDCEMFGKTNIYGDTKIIAVTNVYRDRRCNSVGRCNEI